jgi:membrane protein DedA with SNARE-associated domain
VTEHLLTFVTHHGTLAVFVLMALESACIPIPSEVVMPFAGYLSYHGTLSLAAVVIAATLANVVGGLVAYAVGRVGGRPFILRYGRYILLSQRHLEQAESWFERRGDITVLICRMLPALRTFISLPAGVARMPVGRFLLYSAIGSLPWNFVLAYAGFKLGQYWSLVDTYVKPLTYVGALVLVAAVVWFWFGRRTRSQSPSR